MEKKMMAARHSDVLIVGGGVVGLACAYYLNQDGKKVRIVEKETVGSGASHGNCGLLFFSDLSPICSPGAVGKEFIRVIKGKSPLYIAPRFDAELFWWLLKFVGKCNPSHLAHAIKARADLMQYSMDLFHELFSSEHLECDEERKGVLIVFKDNANIDAYGKANMRLKPFGFDARFYDQKALLKLEPALKENVKGAWYHPKDHHLRPDWLMKAWKRAILEKGVLIEENCRVTDLLSKGGRVAGVETSKGVYTADHHVLASGAWTPGISKMVGVKVPVQPGKGYSITMDRPKICPGITCYLYESNTVATPFKSGYRLGGTMEFSGFNDNLIKKRIENLRKAAKAYMKSPLGYPVREEWVGIRPMTHDDLPIIDKSPNHENLYLATGHGMIGLTTATATGRIISDMVSGKIPDIDPEPFSLKRF